MKKEFTGIACVVMLLTSSQAFSNKNPCNVDCVKKLIENNPAVGGAAGIGSATSSMIRAFAQNSSIGNTLECSFRATLNELIQTIKASSSPVNDCASGAGIANGGLLLGYSKNPSTSRQLNCFDYLGLKAIDSVCHTNYSSGSSWVPEPGPFDPSTCIVPAC